MSSSGVCFEEDGISKQDVCFVEDGISKRFRIQKETTKFSLLVYEDSVCVCEDDLLLQVVIDSSGNYLWSPLHGKIRKIVLYYDAANTNNGFVTLEHVDGTTTDDGIDWQTYFGYWGGFPNPILEALQEWLGLVKYYFSLNNVVEVYWNTPPITQRRHRIQQEHVSPPASRSHRDEAFRNSPRTQEEDVSPPRYYKDEAFQTLRNSMIGKRLTKIFPGHGAFRGTVMQYGIATDNYLVRYDDGDEETIKYDELRSLLDT